ncbi:MAG: ABC transporter permease [Candidatus Kapabacteria bacterium]|nr:ABC transporter permease [Candidatus Kapabacteria bacterium]
METVIATLELYSKPVALVFLAAWGLRLESRSPAPAVVAVLDGTGLWLRRLQYALAHRVDRERPVLVYPLVPEDTIAAEALKVRIARGEWEGMIWLYSGTSGLSVRLWGRTASMSLVRELLQTLENELRGEVIRHMGIPEPMQALLRNPVQVWEYRVADLGAPQLQQIVSVVAVLLLSSAVVWAARMVTEERFSQVTEFLLSIVPPHELVLGKFVAALGLGSLQLLGLGIVWHFAGETVGTVFTAVAVLLMGYAVAAAAGLWLALRTSGEAQLHGAITLILLGLFAAPVLAAWVGHVVVPVLAVVPFWMPTAVLWFRHIEEPWLVTGGVVAVIIAVALLWDATSGVRRLVEMNGK